MIAATKTSCVCGADDVAQADSSTTVVTAIVNALMRRLSDFLDKYREENGRGMVFNDDADEPTPDDSGPKTGKRPALKIVK